MKLTALVTIVFVSLASLGSPVQEETIAVYHPARGAVPDEGTAIAIAEAILTPIYGAKHIKAQPVES